MKSVLMRVLLFVIAIPALFLGIWFSPKLYDIPLLFIILFFSVVGAIEARTLYQKVGTKLNTFLTVYLGAIGPVVTYLYINFENINRLLLFSALIFSIWLVFIIEGFSRKKDKWMNSIPRVSGYSFIILYVTVFSSFFMLLTNFENYRLIYLLFLSLVFSNDTFAYLVGVSIGRFSPKPTPISPNKSLFGFIGGGIFTVIVAIIFFHYKSELFANNVWAAILTAILISFCAIIGDLIESAFKRSAELKDSGKIMLGRGGVLDSIDSLLISAPVLFFLLKFFETLK